MGMVGVYLQEAERQGIITNGNKRQKGGYTGGVDETGENWGLPGHYFFFFLLYLGTKYRNIICLVNFQPYAYTYT